MITAEEAMIKVGFDAILLTFDEKRNTPFTNSKKDIILARKYFDFFNLYGLLMLQNNKRMIENQGFNQFTRRFLKVFAVQYVCHLGLKRLSRVCRCLGKINIVRCVDDSSGRVNKKSAIVIPSIVGNIF